MDTIGSRSDAEFILNWVRDAPTRYGRSVRVEDEEAPEGWEYISCGSFRSVWASPDGVAYKVQHSSYSNQSNGEEYNNIQKAHDLELPMGSRVPKAALFEFEDESIIAMEVIDGELLYHYRGERQGELYEILHACETKLRLCDLHDENVIIEEDGTLVVVDLGG